MAVTRAQKVRLGIFVATGLAAFGVGLVVLAGMKLGEKRDSYSVRFQGDTVSLSGLDVGSPVKYSGIKVGRVDSIRIAPDDVSTIVVQLTLDGGTPVAEDSVASLGSLGITGLKYVELSRGSREARIREPGEEIPSGPSLIDELSDQATQIAAKIDVLIDRLNTFTTPEMKGKVSGALDRTNRLLDTTEQTVSENRGNLKQLSGRLDRTAEEIEGLSKELRGTATRANRLLDETRPRVVTLLDGGNELVGELRQSRQSMDQVLQESHATLVETRAALGPEGLGATLKSTNQILARSYLVLVQSQEQIEESLRHLRETSENMSSFSQRIKEDPSLLLLGTDDEEAER